MVARSARWGRGGGEEGSLQIFSIQHSALIKFTAKGS